MFCLTDIQHNHSLHTASHNDAFDPIFASASITWPNTHVCLYFSASMRFAHTTHARRYPSRDTRRYVFFRRLCALRIRRALGAIPHGIRANPYHHPFPLRHIRFLLELISMHPMALHGKKRSAPLTMIGFESWHIKPSRI